VQRATTGAGPCPWIECFQITTARNNSVVDRFVTLTEWPRSIVGYELALIRMVDGGGRSRPDWKKALNAHDSPEYVSSDHLKGVRILLVEDTWHLGMALKDLLLAPQHPEWKDTQPFKAALEGDVKALAEAGERGILEMFMAWKN
jgi:hypothetical protein